MIEKISGKEAVKIWARYGHIPEDHISEQRLYRFSLPGGMKEATENEMQHLSVCPKCFCAWQILCSLKESSQGDEPDEKKKESILSYGFLQAASSSFTEPVYLSSACEKFTLGIFPRSDNPEKAMIVLETTGDWKPYHNMLASIKDANGTMVIEATIKQGRAASITHNLDILDLSTWTIVIIQANQ